MLVPVAIRGGGGVVAVIDDGRRHCRCHCRCRLPLLRRTLPTDPPLRGSGIRRSSLPASAAAFLARSFSQASCTRLTRCAPPRALTLVPCPSLVSQRLKIDPKEHKIMLTEAAMNPKKNREKLVETMFETFGFNGVHCSIQVARARKRDAAIGLHLAMVRRRLRRNCRFM